MDRWMKTHLVSGPGRGLVARGSEEECPAFERTWGRSTVPDHPEVGRGGLLQRSLGHILHWSFGPWMGVDGYGGI